LADTVGTYAAYDWTGGYLGGFAGGGAGAKTNTTESYSSGWGGTWITPKAAYGYNNSASFLGGGTVGYNWQVANSPLVLGLEGEYGYLGANGRSPDPNGLIAFPNATVITHSTNIGSAFGYALAGGRIGYALDRILFYVKSGAVFTSIHANYDSPPYQNFNTLNISSKSNIVAYAIGAGFEYALPFEWAANHVTIKTEYLYLGIDSTQTASAMGTDGYSYVMTDKVSGIHTAKLGINYKF
jgi:outer membrane immunogenic protein